MLWAEKWGKRFFFQSAKLKCWGSKLDGKNRNELIRDSKKRRYYYYENGGEFKRSRGFSYVPYSSAINAYQRISLMKLVVEHSDKILRAQSDSVLCKEKLNIDCRNELGYYSEVEHEEGSYKAKSSKMLLFANVLKASGIPIDYFREARSALMGDRKSIKVCYKKKGMINVINKFKEIYLSGNH